MVDAIFGTGFKGAAREPAAGAIEAINRCGAPVIACDIASGVDASSGEVEGVAVEADLTISFHAAKLGHRIAPGKWHTGELRVEPIGIPDGAPSAPAGGTIRPRCPRPAAPAGIAVDQVQLRPGCDRGRVEGADRGGADVVAGGDSGRRRLRDGRGPGRPRGDLRELAARGDVGWLSGGRRCLAPAGLKAIRKAFERAAAGVLGPGMGRDPGSVELAREAVAAIEVPLVIDADGLNAFAGEIALLGERLAPTVLTPHAGELGRLLGRPSEQIAARRLAAAREAATAAGAIVVLKGDDTIVTDGERVAINALAAPALATAGTGDVLSGITAAMLARGLEPFAAACAAVFAHARAGRDAARRIGSGRVGDRHRRDRLDPGGNACRRAGRITSRHEDRRRDHGRRRADRLA